MAENLDAVLGGRDVLRGQIVPDANGNLVSPTNIVKTIQAAKNIYFKFRAEHVKRIDLYAKIEGLIAGNPPYNPAELQKFGLLHIANFNTLDARSLYKRGALAYWNLLNQAEVLFRLGLRFPGEKGKAPELIEYADIMSHHLNDVIRSWPSYNTLTNMHGAQIVKLGISPIFWPDERDWRWRVVDLSKFFVQDQCQSDIEQITAVCVESFFTVQYLFEVYEEIKDKKPGETPWSKDELTKLLLHMANTHAKTNFEFIDFVDMQRRLQNGDVCYDAIFSDSIRLVSLFYKEYDGKISHYMFHRNYDNGDFLYRFDNQYDCLQDAFVIFTASPGEATIHSNRGTGHELYSLAQAMNQIDCSIVDTVRWSSTPMVKGLSTGTKDFEAIRFIPGVPTNIGTAEFVQNNMGANIDQMIGGSQYLLNKLQYNIANAGDDPSQPDASVGSVSPSQARMQSYKEFGVLKNNIAHYYNQYDIVGRNMVSRMLKSKKGDPGYEYAHEWKQRCLDDGVPEELFSTGKMGIDGLPRHLRCKASRVAGDGSTLARIMGLQELQFLMPTFGPKQAREYQREYITATMGVDYLPVFLPDSSESDERAGGASLAGVENAVMKTGESAVFSMDNEHQSHMETHLALGDYTVKAIAGQQMDPIDGDKIFTVLIPHMAEHFEAIIRSPFSANFVEQVKKPFDQITQYARLNKKNAESMLQARIREQQEQQAAQQAAVSDETLKRMKTEAEIKRADYKVAAQVKRADQANVTRAEVMKQKIEKDSENQRLKIGLEHQNKTIETTNKNMLERTKAANEATLEQNKAQLEAMMGNTPAPADIEM